MKWRDIPSATPIIELIQQQLDLILPSVHGYSLITLGELSATFNYQAAAVANVVRISCQQEGNVCALAHQLPLASDDIDAIFIPLLLEQSDYPHQLLRDASRSLRPGGKLILVTFNPLSLWGLYKLVLSRSRNKPWCYPFYRLGRLTDWLSLLGLDVVVEHGLFAKLPGSEFHQLGKHIGSSGYSKFGALNFLVAEKKVRTLTVIRQSWKKSKVLNSGRVIETTQRNINKKRFDH